MGLAPFFGELAFKGVFEDGLAVALKLGLYFLQGFDAGIEPGEEFLDFGDDAVLLGEWRERKGDIIPGRSFSQMVRL